MPRATSPKAPARKNPPAVERMVGAEPEILSDSTAAGILAFANPSNRYDPKPSREEVLRVARDAIASGRMNDAQRRKLVSAGYRELDPRRRG